MYDNWLENFICLAVSLYYFYNNVVHLAHDEGQDLPPSDSSSRRSSRSVDGGIAVEKASVTLLMEMRRGESESRKA